MRLCHRYATGFWDLVFGSVFMFVLGFTSVGLLCFDVLHLCVGVGCVCMCCHACARIQCIVLFHSSCQCESVHMWGCVKALVSSVTTGNRTSAKTTRRTDGWMDGRVGRLVSRERCCCHAAGVVALLSPSHPPFLSLSFFPSLITHSLVMDESDVWGQCCKAGDKLCVHISPWWETGKERRMKRGRRGGRATETRRERQWLMPAALVWPWACRKWMWSVCVWVSEKHTHAHLRGACISCLSLPAGKGHTIHCYRSLRQRWERTHTHTIHTHTHTHRHTHTPTQTHTHTHTHTHTSTPYQDQR